MAAISSLQIGGSPYEIYAGSAVKDGSGNVITSTYGKKVNDVYYVTAGYNATTYPAFNSATVYTSGKYVVTGGRAYSATSAVGTTGTAGSWASVSSKFTTANTVVVWSANTTGTDEVTALTAGLTISLKVPTNLSGGATTQLNLNGLGAKTIKYNNNWNLTTHLNYGTVVPLTYDGTYWQWANYDSNTNSYVTQNSSTEASAFPIILKRTTGGNETNVVKYASAFTYNPSTSSMVVKNISAQNITSTNLNGSSVSDIINSAKSGADASSWIATNGGITGISSFKTVKAVSGAGTSTAINANGSASDWTLQVTGTMSISADTATRTITLSSRDNNTKNTVGATTSTAKMYLVGATATGDSVTSNVHTAVYASGGDLYANNVKATTFSGNLKGTNISGATSSIAIDTLITNAGRTIGNGKLTITTGDTTATGTFSANQTGDTTVTLGSMALKKAGEYSLSSHNHYLSALNGTATYFSGTTAAPSALSALTSKSALSAGSANTAANAGAAKHLNAVGTYKLWESSSWSANSARPYALLAEKTINTNANWGAGWLFKLETTNKYAIFKLNMAGTKFACSTSSISVIESCGLSTANCEQAIYCTLSFVSAGTSTARIYTDWRHINSTWKIVRLRQLDNQNGDQQCNEDWTAWTLYSKTNNDACTALTATPIGTHIPNAYNVGNFFGRLIGTATSAESAPVGSHTISSHSDSANFFSGNSARTACSATSASGAGSATQALKVYHSAWNADSARAVVFTETASGFTQIGTAANFTYNPSTKLLSVSSINNAWLSSTYISSTDIEVTGTDSKAWITPNTIELSWPTTATTANQSILQIKTQEIDYKDKSSTSWQTANWSALIPVTSYFTNGSAKSACSATSAKNAGTARNGNFYLNSLGIPTYNSASTYAVGAMVYTANSAFSASAAAPTATGWAAVSSKFTRLPVVTWSATDTSITGLYNGLTLWVKVPGYGGTASSAPTNIAINGSAAKQIRYNNANYTSHYAAGSVIHMVYDGTYFQVGDRDTNDNNKVNQYRTTANTAYPIILKWNNTTASGTNTVNFNESLTYNPNTSALVVKNISSVNITATASDGNAGITVGDSTLAATAYLKPSVISINEGGYAGFKFDSLYASAQDNSDTAYCSWISLLSVPSYFTNGSAKSACSATSAKNAGTASYALTVPDSAVSGKIIGTANNAKQVSSTHTGNNANYYLEFIESTGNGYKKLYHNTGLQYNPSAHIFYNSGSSATIVNGDSNTITVDKQRFNFINGITNTVSTATNTRITSGAGIFGSNNTALGLKNGAIIGTNIKVSGNNNAGYNISNILFLGDNNAVNNLDQYENAKLIISQGKIWDGTVHGTDVFAIKGGGSVWTNVLKRNTEDLFDCNGHSDSIYNYAPMYKMPVASPTQEQTLYYNSTYGVNDNYLVVSRDGFLVPTDITISKTTDTVLGKDAAARMVLINLVAGNGTQGTITVGQYAPGYLNVGTNSTATVKLGDNFSEVKIGYANANSYGTVDIGNIGNGYSTLRVFGDETVSALTALTAYIPILTAPNITSTNISVSCVNVSGNTTNTVTAANATNINAIVNPKIKFSNTNSDQHGYIIWSDYNNTNVWSESDNDSAFFPGKPSDGFVVTSDQLRSVFYSDYCKFKHVEIKVPYGNGYLYSPGRNLSEYYTGDTNISVSSNNGSTAAQNLLATSGVLNFYFAKASTASQTLSCNFNDLISVAGTPVTFYMRQGCYNRIYLYNVPSITLWRSNTTATASYTNSTLVFKNSGTYTTAEFSVDSKQRVQLTYIKYNNITPYLFAQFG